MTVYDAKGAKLAGAGQFHLKGAKPRPPCISFNELLVALDIKRGELLSLLRDPEAPKAVLRKAGGHTISNTAYYRKAEALKWLREKLKEKT